MTRCSICIAVLFFLAACASSPDVPDTVPSTTPASQSVAGSDMMPGQTALGEPIIIELPKAPEKVPPSLKIQVFVSTTQIFMGPDAVASLTDADWQTKVTEALASANPEKATDTVLIIAADKDVTFEIVVQVMDLAKQEGIANIAFAVAQK
jgi:biopolymer transport protein ExbD